MDASQLLSAHELAAGSLNHMHIESRTDSGMVLRLDCTDGTGKIRVYSLFPGILLAFNDFEASSVSSYGGEINQGLKLNYCVEGRCEILMSDDFCLCLEPGDLSIDTREVNNLFSFPGGRYHGVELFFHRTALQETPPRLFRDMGIDVPAIGKKFCPDRQSFIGPAHEKIKNIFMTMNNPPLECETAYYRIKVTELLLLLNCMNFPAKNECRSFLTMGQTEIARQVMATITADLSKRHSMEKLAEGYGISPASLRNYFRSVYGKSMPAYLHEARMSMAATALKETGRTIADIAAAAGYENASKFAAAFKAATGHNPLEYRRQYRCLLTNSTPCSAFLAPN
ncbi:MAG TPA: AraC family transcriptional regulator [Negativicutes bacterium]|nr:AraC family transcriptional regulator [Negativicutes bacterium]